MEFTMGGYGPVEKRYHLCRRRRWVRSRRLIKTAKVKADEVSRMALCVFQILDQVQKPVQSHIQSNLYIKTALGTKGKWSLYAGGLYTQVTFSGRMLLLHNIKYSLRTLHLAVMPIYHNNYIMYISHY